MARKVFRMGKKANSRLLASRFMFRESDFAGMQPEEQAQLSGSLNQLSEQLASTRKALRDIEQASLPPELIPDGPGDTPVR
jgi:hypothetical protein